MLKINKPTHYSGFYDITDNVRTALKKTLKESKSTSGILHLFCMHTSCALLINEGFDSTAKKDLELFFDFLAPQSLPFIRHTVEGRDDSPAHMKSALLHQHIALIVENSELILGQWQGIFLAEFRNDPHQRTIVCKYQPDFI